LAGRGCKNGYRGEAQGKLAVRSNTLSIPLLSSCAIHVVAILFASTVIQKNRLSREEFFPIRLVDLPRTEQPTPAQKVDAPLGIKKPLSVPPKVEKPKETEVAKPERPARPPALITEVPARAAEAKPAVPAKEETAPGFASGTRVEGGGSEVGAGNLFGKGDVGVVPGPGDGGGGGTAASGLGRGSGVPGLPAQTVLRTNREAKPIQTVRAAYPAIALRMGLESDVTLKIEVDAEGKVTKAEVTNSGGGGFDEEALKAVRQSRFEPAQRDGQNIPAQFTYVYRFRLQR
jgi:TonB family protein